ncbi:hypothetical protein [Caldithrix abyssi]
MAIKRLVKFNLPLILASAFLSMLIVLAIFDFGRQTVSEPPADQCLTCHDDERDMSAAHPNKVFGCAKCHLGNPLVADKKIAHQGMVKNPSDLHWVHKTCGQAGCHPQWAARVPKSIMTTNSGLVASTLYQWEEKATPDDSTLHIAHLPDTSLATSHLRKMCAGCHINKPTGDLPGEFGERGGGCNDCHLVQTDSTQHPALTVQISIAVCEKCHNRSDRTGLTYQGKFESEGYGTPFKQGSFSDRALSGNRFYYHILPDVHFEKGMVCIDCHPAEDVMGDGRKYAHLEEQVHVRCETCHQAQFAKPPAEHLVWKAIESNPALSAPRDSLLARAGTNIYLSNVFQKNGQVVLVRKIDGRELTVQQNQNRTECVMPGHERLSCQSCHSAYTPQCYGCHDVYDLRQKQLDKISLKETEGRWSEGRSYLRFEEPTLGVDARGRIMPFAPGCQVYLTVLDKKGRVQKEARYLTMAPFDPHSTRLKVPQCEACHQSAKRLGLGEGTLRLEDGALKSQTLYDAPRAALGNCALEQMVDVEGRPTQKMSRLKARPFNALEIRKIFRVSYCLICHDRADDAIYNDFGQSVRRFNQDKTLPCNRLAEERP